MKSQAIKKSSKIIKIVSQKSGFIKKVLANSSKFKKQGNE